MRSFWSFGRQSFRTDPAVLDEFSRNRKLEQVPTSRANEVIGEIEVDGTLGTRFSCSSNVEAKNCSKIFSEKVTLASKYDCEGENCPVNLEQLTR